MTDNLPLNRLLGPAAPEVGCDECFEYLDAYVERSLGRGTFAQCRTCVSPDGCAGAERCLGMAAHLGGCPACAEEYESLRALVADE